MGRRLAHRFHSDAEIAPDRLQEAPKEDRRQAAAASRPGSRAAAPEWSGIGTSPVRFPGLPWPNLPSRPPGRVIAIDAPTERTQKDEGRQS